MRAVLPSERVIAFIETYLRTPSGKNATKPFVLREWQKKLIRDVYDNVNADGKRITRRVLWSMAKKNGKTALIAALVLVHLVGPEAIPTAEIYSGANSKKQAALIFNAAWAMVRTSPELSQRITAIPSRMRLVCHEFGSFYMSLSSDGDVEEGISPTVWIVDELGRTKKPSLYESLSNATGAWEEPLGFIISVQARSPHWVMSTIVNAAKQMLRGDIPNDPTWSCAIFEVPEDADPLDESVWPLANPALGDFKNLEDMRTAANDAKRNPSRMPSFRNLHLNQQIDDVGAVVHTREDWEACGGAVDEEALRGQICFGGLDLSRKIDLTALALVFEQTPLRPTKHVVVRCWTPEHGLDERSLRDTKNAAVFRQWVEDGHLIAVPGKAINFRYVAKEIKACREKFQLQALAYDRAFGIPALLEALDEEGVPYWVFDTAAYARGEEQPDENPEALCIVPHGQGFLDMSPAIERMEIDVMNHDLSHGNQPVLKWATSNAVTMQDPNSNRKLAKSRARSRIDPYCALAMANNIASRPKTKSQVGSIWDDIAREDAAKADARTKQLQTAN